MLEKLPIVSASEHILSKSAGVAKLFQTESRFAMLFRTGGEAPDEYPTFCATRGETLNWLQVLDSTSADHIRKALKVTNSVSRCAQQFPMRIRLSTSDGASSNIRAEKDLIEERPGWSLVHILCEVQDFKDSHLCPCGD